MQHDPGRIRKGASLSGASATILSRHGSRHQPIGGANRASGLSARRPPSLGGLAAGPRRAGSPHAGAAGACEPDPWGARHPLGGATWSHRLGWHAAQWLGPKDQRAVGSRPAARRWTAHGRWPWARHPASPASPPGLDAGGGLGLVARHARPRRPPGPGGPRRPCLGIRTLDPGLPGLAPGLARPANLSVEATAAGLGACLPCSMEGIAAIAKRLRWTRRARVRTGLRPCVEGSGTSPTRSRDLRPGAVCASQQVLLGLRPLASILPDSRDASPHLPNGI